MLGFSFVGNFLHIGRSHIQQTARGNPDSFPQLAHFSFDLSMVFIFIIV